MMDYGVPITLDMERRLIFNLNVMEKCIERYKDMNTLLNIKKLESVTWLGLQMLNEDAEIWNEEHPDNKKPMLTEKQLKRLIVGIGKLNEFQKKVQEAMLIGLPQEQIEEIEEKAEELEKNLMAAQSLKKKNQK